MLPRILLRSQVQMDADKVKASALDHPELQSKQSEVQTQLEEMRVRMRAERDKLKLQMEVCMFPECSKVHSTFPECSLSVP
jgi:hypothetical protein